MSSAETKRKKQFDTECEKQRIENARKEALGMWERIEEADCDNDMKDILHRIAKHVGMEY